MRLWDVSQTLRPGVPVYPGDAPFRHGWTVEVGEGGSPVAVGWLHGTTHCGTHLDAPRHWDRHGSSPAELDSALFLGPCRVLDLRDTGSPIGPDALTPNTFRGCTRLLLRTRHGPWPERWDPDYACVTAEATRRLGEAGVRLLGIDTPSIDPADSADLPAHMAARDAGMVLLEGLVLDAVPAGDYELIALPLKLAGLDASPVRAVLRELPR